jgi:IAA-amino acid hydrolase
MPDAHPPTVNDPTLFDNFSKHVGSLVSKEGMVRDIVPTMGGEDFSFLAQAIPSTFFMLGQGTGQDAEHHLPATDFGLHHPQFALDEDVMPTGVDLHVNLALRALKKLSVDSLASGDSVGAMEL